MSAKILFRWWLSKGGYVAHGLDVNHYWFASVLSETKHLQKFVN